MQANNHQEFAAERIALDELPAGVQELSEVEQAAIEGGYTPNPDDPYPIGPIGPFPYRNLAIDLKAKFQIQF
jgi:hypothetical protein